MRHVRLVVVAASLVPAAAWAGDLAWYEPFEVVEDPADTTPPAAPQVQLREVKRGLAPQDAGCNEIASSTDDFGQVRLELEPAGDGEPLGYRFLPVDGAVPFGTDYAGPVVVRDPTWIRLDWVDGASDEQEPLDFTVHVVAVDRAGNESAPTVIHVTDPGSTEDGGCAAGGGGLGGLLALLLLRHARKGGRA